MKGREGQRGTGGKRRRAKEEEPPERDQRHEGEEPLKRNAAGDPRSPELDKAAPQKPIPRKPTGRTAGVDDSLWTYESRRTVREEIAVQGDGHVVAGVPVEPRLALRRIEPKGLRNASNPRVCATRKNPMRTTSQANSGGRISRSSSRQCGRRSAR